MKRQIRFIKTLIQMRLSHMMVFRLSFFGAFFVDGTMFLVQILMFSSIYSQVDTIGNWGRGEMLFFIGTFSLINAVNMAVYFFGLNGIPFKIKEGGLDHYLTKPVSPLLRLTFESVDPGSIPLVLASIGILLYAGSILTITITAARIAGYVFLVLLMLVLYYDMELILRTIPFFVISAASIERLEGELITLCMKIPGSFFKGFFKILFYLVLPYGIMATLPTQFFAGFLTPLGYLYAVGVTVVFTTFALFFWRFGLKHYKSASS